MKCWKLVVMPSAVDTAAAGMAAVVPPVAPVVIDWSRFHGM
jgi:hypothetical protein